MTALSSRIWEKVVQAFGQGGDAEASDRLGDFTTGLGVISISAIAIGIGVVSAFVALALLRLIGLFTNLFFFQRWDTALVTPADNTLGPFEILVPIMGRSSSDSWRDTDPSASAATAFPRPSKPS